MKTVADLRKAIAACLAMTVEPNTKRSKCDAQLFKPLLQRLSTMPAGAKLGQIVGQHLLSIYQQRWQQVMHSPYDYTRNQEGINAHWISLAKLLTKSGLIEGDCYQLLMPSLNHHLDPITFQPISDTPLSHCTLSDDGQTLIRLQGAFDNLKLRGQLVYFTPDKCYPFSEHEITRIDFSAAHLRARFHEEIEPLQADSERISLKTVQALKKLVTDSCFRSGSSGYYDNDENGRSVMALFTFHDYLSTLCDKEKNALMTQRIEISPTYARRFADFWRDIQGYSSTVFEPPCLTYLMKCVCQLLKDYIPDIRYKRSNDALGSAFLNNWAKGLLPSKYKKMMIPGYTLSQDDYRLKCEQLLCYILSHPFKLLAGKGREISFCGFSQTVPETAYKIYREIQRAADHHNYQFAYYRIVEKVVKPCLETPQPFRRYDETQRWLKSIAKGSFVYDDTMRQQHTQSFLNMMASVPKSWFTGLFSRGYEVDECKLARLKTRYAEQLMKQGEHFPLVLLTIYQAEMKQRQPVSSQNALVTTKQFLSHFNGFDAKQPCVQSEESVPVQQVLKTG